MLRTFRQVAVVDRGDAALRLVRAVRDLAREHGPFMRALVLEVGRSRLALAREADDVLRVEPAVAEDPVRLVAALAKAGVDAVFPGWGDPASHAALARACASAGLAFVGPSAEALERLPAFVTPVADVQRLEALVALDASGDAVCLGIVDTSTTRRGDIVMAEYDGRAQGEPTHQALAAAAIEHARAAGLTGVVTVVFLIGGAPTFLGIMPCLSWTHIAVDGADLATLQLELALGASLANLTSLRPGLRHALAVRVALRDPLDPSLSETHGTLALLRVPTGPGIRIDAVLEPGDTVEPGDDPVLLRIVANGSDRAEAFARLRRAVSELAVVMPGGVSDRSFVLRLLDHPEVVERRATAALLHREGQELCTCSGQHVAVALVAGAIDAYDLSLAAELDRFVDSTKRGRLETRVDIGLGLELRHLGQLRQLHVERLGRDRYRVRLQDRVLDVERRRLGPFEARLAFATRAFRVITAPFGDAAVRVEVEGLLHMLERDPHRTVVAPAPAVVARVECRVGDRVAVGDRLVTLEAMKLEMPIFSPIAGRVRTVRTIANEQVGPGAPLVVIEPEGSGIPMLFGEPLDLSEVLPTTPQLEPPAAALMRLHRDCRSLLLGYDVPPATTQALVQGRKALARQLAPDDPALLASEDELLRTFADIQSLFRRRAAGDETEPGLARSPQEHLFLYLRTRDANHPSLPRGFVDKLRTAVAHLGVKSLAADEPALTEALYALARSRNRLEAQASPIAQILERRVASGIKTADPGLRETLDRIALITRTALPGVADLARLLKRDGYDEPLVRRQRDALHAAMEVHIEALCARPDAPDRGARLHELVACPEPLTRLLNHRFPDASHAARLIYLEIVLRRYYRIRDLKDVHTLRLGERELACAHYDLEGKTIQVRATWTPFAGLAGTLASLAGEAQTVAAEEDVVLDVVLGHPPTPRGGDALAEELGEALGRAGFDRPIRRVCLMVPRGDDTTVQYFTFRPAGGRFIEERVYRGLHPMMGKRLELWRLSEFDLERLDSVEEIYLFRAVARANKKDERFLALAEIRDLTPARDAAGRIVGLPHLERVLNEAFAAVRRHNATRPLGERLFWNRVYLYVRPPCDIPLDHMAQLARRMAAESEGLGLEKVVARIRLVDPMTQALREAVLEMDNPNGNELALRVREPGMQPLRPLSEYAQKVIRSRQLGLVYPYEILRMLAPAQKERRGVGDEAVFPPGRFIEYDLDAAGTRLVPVEREPGQNNANLIVGLVTNHTAKYPEGMTRVVMLGDPLRAMGSIAEPECRRLVAALDLAAELQVPVEWYAVCAGARIAMDTGTENLDWTARGIRKLIEHTQAGHEINVVVCGINVGAQSYWNSEATMLGHTKGVLIMVPTGAMVLTGKMALDYSGSVSAEDNYGIGGYEHIMGPNGEAQYWAPDVREACRILLLHYDFAFIHPGERFPRRARTTDPVTRDVSDSPHAPEPGIPFRTIGEVFSPQTNPDRKQPYSVREVMRAICDQDQPTLERWSAMVDAEIAVVWDGHLGGYPVCMIGIESKPLPRTGWVPADGPQEFTAATLFPQSSKKIARAINACSNNRPVVIIANLSGFDGSPESMRKRQLEYGAEIARSVVNFKGPIVFCVVARYHGGAYVVFSNRLQDQVEVAALEGTYASVIGGAPAAAVVFAGEVKKRTLKDTRIVGLNQQIEAAAESERSPLRRQLAEVTKIVRSEKLGEVAVEFDNVHTVKRAQEVGSIDALVPPARLRPYLVDAVERGIRKTLDAG